MDGVFWVALGLVLAAAGFVAGARRQRRRDLRVLRGDTAGPVTLDAFRDLLAAVYDAVEGVPDTGHPTFEDGARGVRVLEALAESAESGRWTEVAG